ncbi:hypothetical protein QNI19_29535 [Cytophagaceae bacterium DM2B3-1]|uniref:Lipoprotein n=1 Tax=Xanthocytophaga flava TaxID=3048013 RepID=A0ABT7CTR0_9BACT|nr:hypothetical protein [Xanthocytophaga flavus]MDJ1471860.1 hypothetical protein [Xanthocytophaga flavus]MDJ1497117.1 hypothetical protein [Xanthocytophaga flavus]
MNLPKTSSIRPILLCGLTIIGCNSSSSSSCIKERTNNDSKTVYYDFGKDGNEQLAKGLKLYEEEMFKELKIQNDEYYIRLLSFESNTLVVLDFCRECDARKAIDASSRYFKVTDTFKIPIIVSYDLAYSSLGLNNNGERFDKYKWSGYSIEINRHGKVVSQGFQQ